MIEFRNISLTYPNGHRGLNHVNLKIDSGEFVVVVGLSGAGKSTLVRCINQLVKPTEGELLINGKNTLRYREHELKHLRKNIGMIFQNYNLVNRMSVLRNVLTGRLGYTGTIRSMFGLFSQKDRELAFNSLKRIGIAEKAYSRADELSGGQQQRVSIARALTQQANIILADEPVASLDPPTSHVVMRDLKRINQEDGITTIVNLHFIDMAMEYADRIVGMRNGEIVFDGSVDTVSETTFEEIYGRKIKDNDMRRGSVN
ncbi:phosphonate ABC transporter ATP-binding protein [Sporolactobacillus sp. THM19-2]|jgi:phosphonate transport system ATP-binding protein|uniref:phosphonate ABC transporter ATP-binding protein n=1 Tax=Sporolactobacillus sp. THM19-2 TaxID=2511171 RepID=UPI0010219F13|nr:phosphonate ABC transporter ATP-binding protein [Sporolactobacillus sp. THM19-2]RYL92659.1 phosphonate ABC transporter ATP-binding protein [Sporolactobacillus sp. THM19-2]